MFNQGKVFKIVSNLQKSAKCAKLSKVCIIVQNMHNIPKNVKFAKCGELCIKSRILNQLCKMCKIGQNIHNCVECAKRCDPGASPAMYHLQCSPAVHHLP